MNVWIRLFSVVDSDNESSSGCLTLALTSKVVITIHRTEESARVAATKHGGIVLEVSAASLRGVSEHPEIHLLQADSNQTSTMDEGKADTTAYMSVACNDVPHKTIFESFSTGEVSDTPPQDDPEDNAGYQDLMEFTDEGQKYLESLSVELGGVELHQ